MTQSTGNQGVLLPAATVALHITDADMRDAANALASDWRFARVTFDIREGSIESAIEIYSQYASPELVIVETSSIEAGFTDRLESLASSCSANTSAVVVGPVNDVYLYRKMIDMGVSDYLVKPVTREVLADVISKTLIEKFGAPESKLVAVIGAKGGVGASVIAEEIARAAAKLDEKTMLLDAAGGWSFLSVSMGTEPMTGFSELMRIAASTDEAAFKRNIFSPSEKLSILASGSDAMLDDNLTADGFETVINRLMITYPLVVIDLSGASAAVRKMVITKANHISVVSTPTLPSLRAARALLQEIKNMRGDSGDNLELILNKQGQSAGFEVSSKDIEQALDRKPALTISYDDKVFAASIAQGKAIGDVKGGEAIATSILNWTRGMLKVKETAASTISKNDTSKLGGILSMLSKKKG